MISFCVWLVLLFDFLDSAEKDGRSVRDDEDGGKLEMMKMEECRRAGRRRHERNEEAQKLCHCLLHYRILTIR